MFIQRFLVFFTFLSLYGVDCFGQKVITTQTTIELGTRCEGEKVIVGLQQGGFSAIHRKAGVCGHPQPDIVTDKSNEIEVIGAKVLARKVYFSFPYGSNADTVKVIYFEIKAEKTTEFKIVTRSNFEFLIGDVGMCPNPNYPPESHISEEIYTCQITVIPIPSKPTLIAERFISSGNVIFIPLGCPVEKEGYSYEVNSAYCTEKATDHFSPLKLDYKGEFEGYGSINYRIRCSYKGQCISEPTEFEMGLTYNPPSPGCGPESIWPQINTIENIKQVNSLGEIDLTYHKFSVKSKICDPSKSGCTVAKVFKHMISQNQFITPIPSDLPGVDIFGIDKRYEPKNKPVEPCGIINLPALLGEAAIKLAQEPPQYSLSNPVMTYVDPTNYIAINYTLKEHIFSPGRVLRKVIELCDGIYVLTIGEGLSNIGVGVGQINQHFGDYIFRKVDNRLKKSIEGI